MSDGPPERGVFAYAATDIQAPVSLVWQVLRDFDAYLEARPQADPFHWRRGIALYEAGRFEWMAFQSRLIEAIAAHEAEITDEADYDYWACWLDAFKSLAAEHGWADAQTLHDLEHELEARPAGHDH